MRARPKATARSMSIPPRNRASASMLMSPPGAVLAAVLLAGATPSAADRVTAYHRCLVSEAARLAVASTESAEAVAIATVSHCEDALAQAVEAVGGSWTFRRDFQRTLRADARDTAIIVVVRTRARPATDPQPSWR